MEQILKVYRISTHGQWSQKQELLFVLLSGSSPFVPVMKANVDGQTDGRANRELISAEEWRCEENNSLSFSRDYKRRKMEIALQNIISLFQLFMSIGFLFHAIPVAADRREE